MKNPGLGGEGCPIPATESAAKWIQALLELWLLLIRKVMKIYSQSPSVTPLISRHDKHGYIRTTNPGEQPIDFILSAS